MEIMRNGGDFLECPGNQKDVERGTGLGKREMFTAVASPKMSDAGMCQSPGRQAPLLRGKWLVQEQRSGGSDPAVWVQTVWSATVMCYSGQHQ